MLMPSKPDLRVLIATPFGAGQRGGMDRLVDLTIGAIERDPDARIEASRLVTRGTRSLAFAPFAFARALWDFQAAARRGEVDLLHINVAAGGSAYRKAILARFAHRLGVPYIVHVHGSRFDTFWASLGAGRRGALRPFFEDSEEVVVLGQYWAKLVADHVPAARHKITILPNATAPAVAARTPSTDGRVRISFLGDVGPRKGTPQLVAALGLLADRHDWRAVIAGKGQLQETRDQAGKLGIADRVDVVGWLDPAGVETLLRHTDVFVLPSFAENLPMSILEAFAYGIAVIATPVGAVTEVVAHDRNGLIVPAGDVPALAAALRRLLEHPDLRGSLGAAARQDHAARYEVGAYVARLAALWRRAAHREAAATAGSAAAASAAPRSPRGR